VAQRYVGRVADDELVRKMRSNGAVLIDGPKACGKTETAKRLAKSVLRLDVEPSVRTAVGAAPETLFRAEAPILFDEWQIAPALWDLVRREVDDRAPAKGQFILTGSSTPAENLNRHSGAGRISTLRMRPMSLYETGHSTGEVSLKKLFDGDMTPTLDPGLTVPQLVDRIVIGGWPALLDADVRDGQQWVRDYLTQIVEVDLQALGTRREPEKLRRLLVSLARGVGTPLTIKAMAADVGGEDGPASRNTIDTYLVALRRLMIVEDLPAWGPHMRSTTPLRSAATRFMADPSMAVSALRVGASQLLADLNATGFHFEALVVRDLRVYAQPLGGELYHWRDNNGHEVDCVVVLEDGRWGAFEVKMNPDDIDVAASSLVRFKTKVDTGHNKMGEPAFLGVITTRALAHRRDDGVVVIPIGTIGP
jgi:predicted AAA+ superfamily ATPase